MQSKKIMIIAIVAIIIVGAVSFFGGTKYEKNSLSKQGLLRSGNNMMSQGGNRQPGAQGQNRQGSVGFGRDGNRGNFAAGQILNKDDKSITIKMQDGSSKIIYFSDSTTIAKSIPGATSDLNTGQQIMTNGNSNPDGSISAQNIQIRPEQQN
jgi:hypothetical protein